MTEKATPEEVIEDTVGGLILPPAQEVKPRRVELTLTRVDPADSSWNLIEHAATLARLVAHTDFVPKGLRDRPAAVAAAMLLGREIGLGPLTSLQRIAVTDDGKIIMEAQGMRAVVLSKGHRMWISEHTSHRVTVHGQRRGEEDVFTVTWTLDDAKRAGLAGRQNWIKWPRQMLTARATAELCRLAFSDVLGGVAYAREEFDDGPDSIRNEDGTMPPPEPAEAVTHARKRKSAKVEAGTAVSPEAAAPPPAGPEAGGEGPPASPAPAETWRDLDVPGDDMPEAVAPAAPPPAASPSPPPTVSASSVVSVDPASGQATLVMPGAAEMRQTEPAAVHVMQKEIEHLAMLCREAKIDRHAVAQAVSGGRTESTRSLTPQEVSNALDRVRAVQRGELRLTVDLGPGEVPRFEGVDEDADLNLSLLGRLKAFRDADEHAFWELLRKFGWKAGVTNSTVTEFVKALTREQRLKMYDLVPAGMGG